MAIGTFLGVGFVLSDFYGTACVCEGSDLKGSESYQGVCVVRSLVVFNGIFEFSYASDCMAVSCGYRIISDTSADIPPGQILNC